MASVKRSFYYYNIEGIEPSLASRMRNVLELDEEIRGQFTNNGQQVLFEVAEHDTVWRGFVTILREDARPELGRRNSAVGSPINMAGNDGVLEKSHFVFSPRHSILVFEYNTAGPRATTFFKCINYLYQTHVDPEARDISWSYVPRSDALDRIRAGQAIASVSFSTKPINFVHLSGNDSSIGDMISDATVVGNRPQKIEIALKGDKKHPVFSQVGDFFTKFLHDHSTEDYESLEVKVVKRNGYIDTIDLVKDHVHSSLSFIGMDNSRRINSNQAYTGMIQALRERYGEL
jgi:hypothetical protein